MGCGNTLCACDSAPTMGAVATASAGANAGILERLAASIDAAIHKDSGGGRAAVLPGYLSLSRSNVIPFPMVNPYRPLLRTRVPVAGLNAFPKVNDIVNVVGYRVTRFNAPDSAAIAEDAGTGLGSLGDFYNPFISPGDRSQSQPFPQGVALPGSGTSSTLQSILDAISRTLPATISALRRSPYETSYYDPANAGQQVAPQQQQYGIAPSGYSYNSSGQLVKDAVGSVTDFVTNNPLLVGGAVLGVVLLFMKSPSGRR